MKVRNVHLRGEEAELERVKVTHEQMDLVRRRTSWVLRACVGFDWSLRTALMNAYFQGLVDCAETFAQRDQPVAIEPRPLEC